MTVVTATQGPQINTPGPQMTQMTQIANANADRIAIEDGSAPSAIKDFTDFFSPVWTMGWSQ